MLFWNFRYLLLPDNSGNEVGPCARPWCKLTTSKWVVNILKIEMILRAMSVLRKIQSVKQTMIAEFDKRRWFYVVSKFSGQELDNF